MQLQASRRPPYKAQDGIEASARSNCAILKGIATNIWAHGVVVSHPLSMWEALGSIPSVSIFASDTSAHTVLFKSFATGTRTWVARVRAEYPNQLDYSGVEVDIPDIQLVHPTCQA